jgi:predicted O-methyltransferase YrrM
LADAAVNVSNSFIGRIAKVGSIVPEPVEQYLAGLNRLADSVLEDIAQAGRQTNLPLIDAEVGALLRVLATAIRATRILEIGTAIGYSGIWLAGALPPGGMLITMEAEPDRAKQARSNFARAGLADRANVMVGDSNLLLAKVSGPFDLIFQDGDKHEYSPQLDRLVDLLRPGGVLVTDNVLWSGEVVPGFVKAPLKDAEETRAIADYNRRLSAYPGLLTVTVPMRDGVSISVRKIGT